MYKLTYFNLRARAEPARYLFKLGGQDFDDVRVEFADWPELKPTTPLGKLPVLDVGGVTLCESLAIYRYLAKQFGYYGADALTQAQVDMVVDCIFEPTHQLAMVWAAKEGDEKKAAGKKYCEEHLEPAFTRVQILLEKNKGGKGYLVGDKLSLADIVLATMGDTCVHFTEGQEVWSKFPKLHAIKQKVEAEPKIAEWMKARPETPY